ncbi:MAG: hypothetical protein ABII07_00800 [Patescibacteria group bacterium]|nr:hypothetical protein [Patescibacteria group bacterium]
MIDQIHDNLFLVQDYYDTDREIAQSMRFTPAPSELLNYWELSGRNPEVVRDYFQTIGEVSRRDAVSRRVDKVQEVSAAKVDQLLDSEDFRPISPEDFEKLPRTKVKLFQEMFCDEHDRQEFREEDSIRRCIVNPGRITATIIRQIGVSDIEGLKEFFIDGLSPLKENYWRVIRINQGENKGKVLITVAEGGKSFQMFDTLHSAIRSIDHTRESHKGEIGGQIADVRAAIEEVHTLLGKWNSMKNRPERQYELQQTILDQVDTLKGVSNESKKAFKARIFKAADLPLNNPGARRTVLISAKPLLRERIDTIAGVSSYRAEDYTVLLNAFGKEAKMGRRIYDLMQEILTLQKGDPKIIENLHLIKEFARCFKFEPYLSFGEKISIQATSIIAILTNGPEPEHIQYAKETFVRMYSASKLLFIESKFMEFRDRFFGPGKRLGDVSFGSLVAALKWSANELLKKAGGNIKVDDYKPVYKAIYELLGLKPVFGQGRKKFDLLPKGLIPDLERARKSNISVEEKIALLQRVDESLKNFDLIKALREEPEVTQE